MQTDFTTSPAMVTMTSFGKMRKAIMKYPANDYTPKGYKVETRKGEVFECMGIWIHIGKGEFGEWILSEFTTGLLFPGIFHAEKNTKKDTIENIIAILTGKKTIKGYTQLMILDMIDDALQNKEKLNTLL